MSSSSHSQPGGQSSHHGRSSSRAQSQSLHTNYLAPPDPLSPIPETPVKKTPPPVTWASLPNKPQLAILALVRVVDFFQVASLQAYMFHQLKSFSPDAPDSKISFQAGVLQGVFTSAQIVTAIVWGRIADASWAGRKNVLLIGLVGTGVSCVGMGYSRTFSEACAWRVLGGAINGTVGAARTMLAETVEKRYHPRAFLLLPAAFNVANIAGPSKWSAPSRGGCLLTDQQYSVD